MNSAIKAKLAEMEQYNREYPRRTVLFKGRLRVNAFEFPCSVVDLSLCGGRIKLDLPLAADAEVQLTVKEHKPLLAKVVWVKDGFIGLKFEDEAQVVRRALGPIGQKLLGPLT